MEKQAWDLLLNRLDTIESNQQKFAKKQDKMLEFRGWVLGAACATGMISGLIGGVILKLFGG